MSEFPGFACWNPAAINETFVRDVGNLRDTLFKAVHHPLRSQKRPIDQPQGGDWVLEDQIVEHFKGPLRGDGYVFIPVVGQAGTGKSHLVRWVYEETKTHPGWRAIPLPKNRTSLRHVVEVLLEGLDGPVAEKAREDLLTAPAAQEAPDLLPALLIDAIAIELERGGHTSERETEDEQQNFDKIRGELPNVLRDAITRSAMTEEGAVIRRLVDLHGNGRSDGDGFDDHSVKVSTADLPLEMKNISQAGDATQRTLRRWAGNEFFRNAAVELINDALPSAIRQVFISNQVSLVEVFRELRRHVHQQANGEELALYIEDLTVLHGVEQQFLDAIVEPPNPVDGSPPMCPLRVIFAVTEYHFRGVKTVTDRCDDAYWLDTPYGTDALSPEEAVSFIGRYLNAGRFKDSKVKKNSCKGCPHESVCHEAFGESPEGHGLYPFNASALESFVKAHAGDDGRFDPRRTVRGLGDFLQRATAAVENSDFPNDEFSRFFDDDAPVIDLDIVNTLGRHWAENSQRGLLLARHWSDSPAALQDGKVALSLKPSVLTTFGLDPTAVVELIPIEDKDEKEKDEKEKDVPDPQDWESRLSDTDKRIVENLNSWAQGVAQLNQRQANDIRALIRKVVWENLADRATPSNPGSNPLTEQHSIVVVGSTTQQNRVPILTIDQSEDVGYALQGLIRLKHATGDTFDGLNEHRIAAANAVDEWTNTVASHIETANAGSLEIAVQTLLLATLVSGSCPESDTPPELTQAIFRKPKPHGPRSDDRTKKWHDLVESAQGKHADLYKDILEMVGESRGSGTVHVVDASRLIATVGSFVDSGDFREAEAGPKVKTFLTQTRTATEAEWRALVKCATASEHIDQGQNWSEQTARVLEALHLANREGQLNNVDCLATLGALDKDADPVAHHSIAELVSILDGDDPTFLEKVCFVASTQANHAYAVAKFCVIADPEFDGVKKALGQAGSASGSANDHTQALTGVLTALGSYETSLGAIHP